MSGLSPSETLHVGITRLSSTWGQVSQEWRDEVAAQFAKEFMKPLQDTIVRYREAVEELEVALDDAERSDTSGVT